MKNKRFISLAIALIFLVSYFNVFNFSKENQSTDLSLKHLTTIANAQSEEMICAYVTGTPGGSFLHLICQSQYFCLYGYGSFYFFDECYHIG